MIYDASRLPRPLHLKADLCVVGSGPGGATVAMVAAEAGMRVLVLEAGAYIPPGQMTQREEEMLPRLLWDAGNRGNRDKTLRLHQGKGVGGSSLHNLNLCKRIPASIRARWAEERGLSRLSPRTWDALYDEVEALIAVSEVAPDRHNQHNRLLARGAAALGWAAGPLKHNRTGCVGSGFCELGCAYDAKNNALKVCVPRAIQAGAEFVTGCQAVTVRHRAGRVEGVDAVALDPLGEALGPVTVDAPAVCLSASATSTAALLLRSRVPDPGGETGRGLRVHPALVVAGDFEAPVRAWEGIPQTWECTEHLHLDREHEPGAHRVWIVPAFAHPMAAATLVPGLGAEHRALMARYAHLAVFSAMIHDTTAGRVRPRGDLGLSIDYKPDLEDRAELSHGVWACARLLFAAGARRVLVPGHRPIRLEREAEVEGLRELDTVALGQELVAVHPMASVPMGDDPARAAVDSAGRHHHLDGLWVADGSLFPTSIGVPPQLSIYALGLHVGRALSG